MKKLAKTIVFIWSIGDSQLSVVWTDPDFNPEKKAVYYVRVLEIPTPRWSTYDDELEEYIGCALR